MCVSAIFVLDLQGKVILCRNYRGDVPLSAADKFVERVVEEEESQVKPVFTEGGITYTYIKHTNLYFLAFTTRNANAAMVLMFLYRLVETFQTYFNKLEEESIRDNFVIVYELMDEMMDFGYPQSCDSQVLQTTIRSNRLGPASQQKRGPQAPPTGIISWRQEGIRYKQNQVFLDVIEQVNLLVSSTGTPLYSEIVGSLVMNCELSGMPDLKLGLNDKLVFEHMQMESAGPNPQLEQARQKAVDLEDVRFHQCVRLAKFDTDRTISFVPPDGKFELMSYRVSKATLKPLIWVENTVEKHAGSRVEFNVKLSSHFKPRSQANNVEVIIPVPPDCDSPDTECSIGSCVYAPERDALVWSIKQLQGGKQYLLKAQLGLPSVQNEEERMKRPPITVKFEIPYFTLSGIQVRYLKVLEEKLNYQSLPWVRYLTKSGDYQLRQADPEGTASGSMRMSGTPAPQSRGVGAMAQGVGSSSRHR
ncbi:Adaptor protein complex 1 (AP-1) [Paratrimastix pyriformis]|uniref:Adaptor protein complex 1 (AP-1) n=1 Tax=Paratrimastix pyriformis TaxID=342808 RepID=A0ABQ8UMI6_9EUKA|nr:Adaptor protein complex 1 (AP-1) [Paratrimastix pyriformis]